MLNDLGDSNLWFENKSVIYTLFSSSKAGDGKNCYLIKMRNEMSVKCILDGCFSSDKYYLD